MSGGGDSAGIGTGLDASSPPATSGVKHAASIAGAAAGKGRLTLDVGGDHVEQHIEAFEQSPWPSPSQPS